MRQQIPHLKPDFRRPMKPGHISGVCHPRQRTVSGPTTRSGHFGHDGFPANRRSPDKLQAYGPTGPPSSGHAQCCPLLPLLPFPADLTYPSSIRRTSPVMTNDRVSSLSPFNPWAECRRNGSAIRRSISCGMPRCPAPVCVRIFVAASCPPLSSGPSAKTREAQGLAGFSPGGFLPLTFLLCHKQKNKSRTF